MILKKELYEEVKLLKSRNIMLQDEILKHYHMELYMRDFENLEDGTLFISVKIDTGGKLSSEYVTNDLFKNENIYINDIKYKKCKEQPQLDIKE
jgi:hypothetical protein